MNYCNFCGNPVKGNEKFCTSCGAAIAPSPNQINQQQPTQQNQQVGFNGQPVNNNIQTGKTTGTAIGGFVCSMVGLIILPFIMGILGLSLSVSGLNHIKTFPQDKGKGLAIAGIVIGIIDIAWAILVGVLSTMK